MQKIFEKIYDVHHWYDEESKSGPGSNLSQTTTVRAILSSLLKELEVKTFLDIPCGDFHWMKELDLSAYDYCGADIVSDIVRNNELMYSNDKRRFIWADITTSKIPKSDFLLCRDCLVHFSYADINKAINNIKNSGSKYLLTTTFPNRPNEDITTGGWRPVNLEAPPFSFQKPLSLYNENCSEGYGQYKDKSLALWSIDSLKPIDDDHE